MIPRYLSLPLSCLILLACVACGQPAGRGPGGQQPALPSGIPGLIAILGQGNAPNRNAAIDALAARGADAVDPLVAALAKDKDTPQGDDTRQGAVEVLAKIGAPAVKPLADALASPEYVVRYSAITALDKIGPAASDALPQLDGLFRSSHYQEEQVAIMYAFADIAPTSAETLGLVQMALLVKNLRYNALRVLGKIGPGAAQSVSRINTYLTDPDEQARNEAIMALQGIGPVEGVVPALVGRLKDQAPRNRIKAADVLGGFGPKGADATSGLAATLKDSDADVRRAVAKALGDIAPASSAAIDPLANALKDSDPQVRREAATSLGKFGALAAGAISALQKAADSDEFPYVKDAAKQAIEAIQTALSIEAIQKTPNA